MNLSAVAADFAAHWPLYLSMPLIAAAIGYATKIVAIRMMFEPLDFRGPRPPWLGWQGIVPRNARRMAGIACDLMLSRLIRPEEVIGRLDPKRVAQELEAPLLASMEEITHEVASSYQPGLWEKLPAPLKARVIQRVQNEAPKLVADIMRDLQANIHEVLDLKHMVVENLTREPALLNRIFQESGEAEFRFIRRSGLVFGFVLGCVQALTWAFTHSEWIMPVFGGLTGWFTDWLALKMIFFPRQPMDFGPVRWQGLFLKHRAEVSARYGALIADEVITPRALIDAILRGPLSDRLFGMVHQRVVEMVDDQAGPMKPLVVLALGDARWQAMKNDVARKTIERLPDTLRHMEQYAGDAMDLRNLLVSKMQQLTEDEFVGLLRPAFQQDEWALIAVGAVLGFLVGELQVFLMLHLGH